MEVKGFGQIVSLENLGPSLVPIRNFDYIRGFVKFMMTELGYIPGRCVLCMRCRGRAIGLNLTL